MPRAYIVAGPLVGRSFELFDGASFGRGEECDVVLPEGSVSRRHASLGREGEHWVLVDASSRNGMRVGEERVERRVLADGDEVALGKVVLRFRVEDADAPPPSSAHARALRPPARSSADLEVTLPLTSRAELELRARAAALGSEIPGAPASHPPSRSEPRAETARTSLPERRAEAPLPLRSERSAEAPLPSSRPERRAELLAELDAEGGGFFTGDLAQRPAWVRWSLYLVSLAIAGAAFAGAFWLVQRWKQA